MSVEADVDTEHHRWDWRFWTRSPDRAEDGFEETARDRRRRRHRGTAAARIAVQPGALSRLDHHLGDAGDHHAGAGHHHRQCRAAPYAGHAVGHARTRWAGCSPPISSPPPSPFRSPAGWPANSAAASVFLISIFVFTVASALCGMAESLAQIVLFRFLQGVGGAALVPLSQAVLFDINPPKDFGRAMSIWGIGVTMGPILGPALGGWLTDNYQLALGVLHQPADRHAGLRRPVLHHAGKPQREILALRFPRLRQPQPRHRRAADDAGPRPVAGLVLLARDRHRGDRRAASPSMSSWSTPSPSPSRS